MATFAIGDIHGNFKALKQCLKRSKFKYKRDTLICLGDVCDGFPFVKDCFDELLKIKNLIYIIGNHDDFALRYYDGNKIMPPEPVWTTQGGIGTLRSYGQTENDWNPMTPEHLHLIKHGNYLYEDENNRLFVHGGIDYKKSFEFQTTTECMWDRHLIESAWMTHKMNPNHKYSTYDTIFVGHTTTQIFKRYKQRHEEAEYEEDFEPIFACNVIDLDTGAGWNGKLTIMNVDTKEYFQSDKARELYPDTEGRTRRQREKDQTRGET